MLLVILKVKLYFILFLHVSLIPMFFSHNCWTTPSIFHHSPHKNVFGREKNFWGLIKIDSVSSTILEQIMDNMYNIIKYILFFKITNNIEQKRKKNLNYEFWKTLGGSWVESLDQTILNIFLKLWYSWSAISR